MPVLALLAAAALQLGSYLGPPVSQATGQPRRDGPAATLRFAWLGAIKVEPLLQPTTRTAQCAVRLRPSRGAAQMVTTIGTGETEALSCGGVRAFGHLPAPRGIYRIGLLYRAYSPNTQVETLVILTRTATTPWRTDDRLADRLGDRAELRTLPDMRRWLTRRGI